MGDPPAADAPFQAGVVAADAPSQAAVVVADAPFPVAVGVLSPVAVDGTFQAPPIPAAIFPAGDGTIRARHIRVAAIRAVDVTMRAHPTGPIPVEAVTTREAEVTIPAASTQDGATIGAEAFGLVPTMVLELVSRSVGATTQMEAAATMTAGVIGSPLHAT